MDAQDLAGATPGQRDSLVRERDELRSKAEEAMRRAREILVAGNVSSIDPEYRAVILGEGNIFLRPRGRCVKRREGRLLRSGAVAL